MQATSLTKNRFFIPFHQPQSSSCMPLHLFYWVDKLNSCTVLSHMMGKLVQSWLWHSQVIFFIVLVINIQSYVILWFPIYIYFLFSFNFMVLSVLSSPLPFLCMPTTSPVLGYRDKLFNHSNPKPASTGTVHNQGIVTLLIPHCRLLNTVVITHAPTFVMSLLSNQHIYHPN